jgi:plastocyanin
MYRRIAGAIGLGGVLLFGGGCGGGISGPNPNAATIAKASPSGDAQSGPAGSPLGVELRVMVTKDGSPVAGRTVTWGVLASGGSANPSSMVTGADGIASTTVTLPPFAATIKVLAASSGLNGSPVQFTATSTGATSNATVLVVNNEFHPDNVELKAGGVVTFTWASGSIQHTVTSVAPATLPVSPGDPATHDAPFSFPTTFVGTGTFRFYCRTHGSPNSGMQGTITVVP